MSYVYLALFAFAVLLIIFIEVYLHYRKRQRMVAEYRHAMTIAEDMPEHSVAELSHSFEVRRRHLQRVQQGLIDAANK